MLIPAPPGSLLLPADLNSDPVGVLRRKLRADAGQQSAMSDAARQVVLAQYAAHKNWSVQLHRDNLMALAETRPELNPAPSYATLRRFMKANGLDKRRRVTSRQTAAPTAPKRDCSTARCAATRPRT